MKKVIAVLFAGLVATTGLVALSQPAQAQCGVGNNWQAKHSRQAQKRAIKQYRRAQSAANLNVYANPYVNTSAYGYVDPYASAYANPYANTSAYGYVDPYASAYTNAYANPYANTYADPYASAYTSPYGSPYNTGLGAGITSSVGATLLNSLLGGL